MLEEACAAPRSVAEQLTRDSARYAGLAQQLRKAPPSGIVTLARGSSDHAANYCAYLIMAHLGRLVTSLPMSLITLHKSPIAGANLLSIAISQSGQSPDLIEPTRYFRSGGATTVALVNDSASPLAQESEWVLPLHAGQERSVAATKSFIASLVGVARLTAYWRNDARLLDALVGLPDALTDAARLDWSSAVAPLAGVDRIMVIGRGLSFPIALEAALKLKETSGIQAEAFSSAEVKHGPMALIDEGYPLLIFATRGPTQAGLIELAAEMRKRRARVWLAGPEDVAGRDLTLSRTGSEDLDPIAAIQSFYVLAEAVARRRGFDPDKPRSLRKVTRTM